MFFYKCYMKNVTGAVIIIDIISTKGDLQDVIKRDRMHNDFIKSEIQNRTWNFYIMLRM